ncbi:MAG: hypothetical protein ACRDHL_05370 [Candidatus Promineifilaceae bacterium]
MPSISSPASVLCRARSGGGRRRPPVNGLEHKGDAALDEWGVAIRVLRKLGKLF